ncbi:MAG: ABC transporter permease subunit [Chloroflexi bacterium]|nr:MAG: ABC transporter permease subunit [Chloroflexota bacterium]
MAQAAPVIQPDLELSYEMPEQVTLLSDAWRRLRRNRLALVGAVIIGLLFITALISIVWTPYPTWLQAVGPTYQPPSAAHPLGLDQAGRDILSRIMGGALITVQVGVGSAIIVSLIGIPLGLLAGFYRGKVDTVISFFINIWYGIPDLLVALILVFVLSDALHLIPPARRSRCGKGSLSRPPACLARATSPSWPATSCPTLSGRSSSRRPSPFRRRCCSRRSSASSASASLHPPRPGAPWLRTATTAWTSRRTSCSLRPSPSP